jgi:hypothetical protein
VWRAQRRVEKKKNETREVVNWQWWRGQLVCSYTAIAHLADHVPCRRNPITFLIVRFIHSRLVLWNKHRQARLFSETRRENLGFTPTALSNGQKPTPPVVREMGLEIEPVDGRWGSE